MKRIFGSKAASPVAATVDCNQTTSFRSFVAGATQGRKKKSLRRLLCPTRVRHPWQRAERLRIGPGFTAGAKIDARVAGLDEKIKALEQELSGYKEKMKRTKGPALKTLRQRAMAVLKRKKMYEQQRDQLSGQAFNIEQTNFAIDSVKDTITTVDAMKTASKTLKSEFKKVNIDKIDDLQDDLADMMEEMNEVQDVLGRSYDVGEDVDEADLDAELDALGDELELGDELADTSADAPPAYLQPIEQNLPEQPTNVPAAPAEPSKSVDEFGLPVAQGA